MTEPDRFAAHKETGEIDCIIEDRGGLKSINMPRWGNPDNREFGYAKFGGIVEKEATFGGYTIPTLHDPNPHARRMALRHGKV